MVLGDSFERITDEADPPRGKIIEPAKIFGNRAVIDVAVKCVHREVAPRWRVNAVAPGLTLPSPAHDEAVMARTSDLMPLQRLPSPQDIAEAVLYFAGARSVTGQILFVDGGASLRGFERDFGNL